MSPSDNIRSLATDTAKSDSRQHSSNTVPEMEGTSDDAQEGLLYKLEAFHTTISNDLDYDSSGGFTTEEACTEQLSLDLFYDKLSISNATQPWWKKKVQHSSLSNMIVVWDYSTGGPYSGRSLVIFPVINSPCLYPPVLSHLNTICPASRSPPNKVPL